MGNRLLAAAVAGALVGWLAISVGQPMKPTKPGQKYGWGLLFSGASLFGATAFAFFNAGREHEADR